MGTRIAASFLLCLLNVTSALGQNPQRYQATAGNSLPAPLWLRVPDPAGMKVTFFRGRLEPKTLTAPFQIALRPGYVSRVKISDIPGHKGLVAFPTLEVRGSLRSEHNFRAKNHPAVLVLSDADFSSVRTNSVVVKVVALERRQEALPIATSAASPQQINVLAGTDPIKEARQRSVPFLIVRMGLRKVPEREMQARSLAGTIWLPGDKTLPLPSVAPWLPWRCLSLYDPRLGPSSLWNAFCLPDGGDSGRRAGVDFLGRLRGVDPSDTIATYTDANGKRRLVASNRVCICVPRYLVFRGEQSLARQVVFHGTVKSRATMGHALAKGKATTLAKNASTHLQGVGGSQSASTAHVSMHTTIVGKYDGIGIKAGVSGLHGVSSTCLTTNGKEAPGLPLILIKWPDKNNAKIGDILTFTLKYTNRNSRPLRDITLTDSLISRFQFVPGSSKSDRPVNFTTQPNDDGSLVLRWQLVGDLPAGQSGIVTFQVRIR